MTTSTPPSSGGEVLQDPLFTWSPEASPANPSRRRVSDLRRTIRAGFGRRPSSSFASYDPAGFCWRTSAVSLDGDWETYSETWPRSGMTRNGTAYQRQPSAPVTSEIEYSLLPTPRWPTPQAFDAGVKPETGQARVESGRQVNLAHAVGLDPMWPTPTAEQGRRMRPDGTPYGKRKNPTLNDAVTMWPTPTARIFENGGDAPGRKGGPSLKGAMISKRGSSGRRLGPMTGGHLNPMWVEWLMGFPLGWTDSSYDYAHWAMPSFRP